MLQRLGSRNARFLTSSATTKYFTLGIPTSSSSNTILSSVNDQKQKISSDEATHNKKSTRYDFHSLCRSQVRYICQKEEVKTQKAGRSDGCESSEGECAVCPGCGVYMQKDHPKAPGYFLNPPPHKPRKQKRWVDVDVQPENREQVIYLDPDENEQKFTTTLHSENESEEDGGRPSKRPAVCARCHSLRSYGKVKDESVENLLPDFDFDVMVGARLMKTTGSRSTVVMVVDTVDFDGSFPRRVAGVLRQAIEEGASGWREGKSGNVPRLVVVGTKIDLLPTHVTPQRLENWVRQRSRFGGAPKLHGLHLVSAHKGWGIKNLAEHIKQMAGPRGNVWVIGAQNAGKSTLINAIGKHVGGSITHLTEAPLPGTTLGIIRVDGILPDKAKLYDTPGILHPYQISTRLNREEQKMVQIRKELNPRTYRLKVGQTVHVGGLMRVEIENASVETIYLTVWASPFIPLHLGKVENADVIKEQHFGLQLQPPVSQERVSELGEWQRRELQVSGNSWDFNSVDIATAGLGWLSACFKGDATLAVWTYDGVDITLRDALILDKSRFFEKSGFTVSNIVSKADKKIDAEVMKMNKDSKGNKNKDSKGETCEDSRIQMASEMN